MSEPHRRSSFPPLEGKFASDMANDRALLNRTATTPGDRECHDTATDPARDDPPVPLRSALAPDMGRPVRPDSIMNAQTSPVDHFDFADYSDSRSSGNSGGSGSYWDKASADALVRLHYPDEPVAASHPGHPASPALPRHEAPLSSGTPAASAHAGQPRLEDQLAEITARIERSFSTRSKESPNTDLASRFDRLEAKIQTALSAVATKDEIEDLRQQLGRSAELSSEDVARMVQAAAKLLSETTTANRSADTHRITEIHELVRALVDAQQRSETQTTSTLDTLQQAMIEVLDRLDALAALHAPAEVDDEGSVHGDAESGESNASSGSVDDAMDPLDDLCLLDASDLPNDAPPAPMEHPVSVHGVDETDERRHEHATVLGDVDRDQLTASARRAAGRPIGSFKETSAAPNKTGEHAVIRSSASARRSTISAALFATLTGLMALGAGATTFAVLRSTVLKETPEQLAAGANRSSEDQANTGAQARLRTTGDTDKPLDASAQAPESQTEKPDQEGTGAREDTPKAESRATAAVELPAGVALQHGETPLAHQLRQAREHQRMAELSGRLGLSQAGMVAVPASLGPETNKGMPSADGTSAGLAQPLDLPPAMIGPLSLRLAAAKGDPSAQFEIAARFAEGKGIRQDFKQAMTWYQRSAQQGFAPSQYRLATLYERGLGVKIDTERARVWYKRAAEQGSVKAMHNLAVLLASPKDGTPDYTVAAHWFGEAADRGLADSQYNIAMLHENGLGIARDAGQSYKWYSLAAQAGDKDSSRRRDLVKVKLSPAELRQAEDLVQSWRAKPVDRSVNDAHAAGEAWKSRQEVSNPG